APGDVLGLGEHAMTAPVVTVANKPHDGDEQRARTLASRYGLEFIPRHWKQPMEDLLAAHSTVFVLAENGLTLWSKEGTLRWSTGMAQLRIMRFDEGDRTDTFLKHAELSEGESVLDCTLGLAQDALMAERAVGPKGRVVGLEKSLPLYVLTAEGLRAHGSRIECIHRDAHAYLREQPARSFDVVVFDPMFDKPGKAQPQFDGLRRFADYSELTVETIEEAKRVARRWVLVKGARYSMDLRKLGLAQERPGRASSVIWARVPAR
ncbi:MAG: protein-L-isoD(D-D) O-methyltransferase, partial [Myxococcaceae bacterium]